MQKTQKPPTAKSSITVHDASELTRLIETNWNWTALDPKCGDGLLFKELMRNCISHIGNGGIIGVEKNHNLGELARINKLTVVQDDFLDLEFDKDTFGMAFIHPPFASAIEALGYVSRTVDCLLGRGVLVLAISEEMLWQAGPKKKKSVAQLIERCFTTVKAFRSIGNDHVILIGVKKEDGAYAEPYSLQKLVAGATAIQTARIIKRYAIPSGEFISKLTVTGPGSSETEVTAQADGFNDHLRRIKLMVPSPISAQRPVMPLRNGHLAQVLASGLTDGEITDAETGEPYLIKGTVTRVEDVTGDTLEETKRIFKDVVEIIRMDRRGVIECIK